MRIVLVSILSAIVLLSGCNMFTTRTPEEPEGGSGAEWVFLRTPKIVLENLETAVGRRSSVDYMKSLPAADEGVSDFEFRYDPDVEYNNSGIFDKWDLERERSHVQRLFSTSNLLQDSLAELSINVTREPLGLSDVDSLSAEYDLHIGHQLDSAPRQMKGQLYFGLKRAADRGWYIYYWRDERIAGYYCWSDLKAKF